MVTFFVCLCVDIPSLRTEEAVYQFLKNKTKKNKPQQKQPRDAKK